MNQQQVLDVIQIALKKTLNSNTDHPLTMETDLLDEKILDSLDAMVFIMEISELTGAHFSDDQDLVAAGLFKIDTLVKYLTDLA